MMTKKQHKKQKQEDENLVDGITTPHGPAARGRTIQVTTSRIHVPREVQVMNMSQSVTSHWSSSHPATGHSPTKQEDITGQPDTSQWSPVNWSPVTCQQVITQMSISQSVTSHWSSSHQSLDLEIQTPGEPASVAQLDARPTGDQEVAGSTPAEVGNILLWRLIMKYMVILSLPLIQEGQLSVSGKRMCTILVNR